MKKLKDILKGFEIEEQWDGITRYAVKHMHSVYFDYFEVNSMDIRDDNTGDIELNVGHNCDFIPVDRTELDQFNVYKLTRIA